MRVTLKFLALCVFQVALASSSLTDVQACTEENSDCVQTEAGEAATSAQSSCPSCADAADVNHLQKIKVDYDDFRQAIETQNDKLVKQMLEAGLDPNTELPMYRDTISPLAYAVNSSNAKVLELLLQAGAHVNFRNKKTGQTALFTAVMTSRISSEGRLAITGYQGCGKHVGLSRGKQANVKVLLQAGADVNIANHAGVTPLMHAVAIEDDELVRTFLDAGANIYVRTLAGLSAFKIAMECGATDIANMLVAASQGIEKKSQP